MDQSVHSLVAQTASSPVGCLLAFRTRQVVLPALTHAPIPVPCDRHPQVLRIRGDPHTSPGYFQDM